MINLDLSKKTFYIEILILFLISFTILNWFRGDYFIKNVDSFFGLNSETEFLENLFSWKYMESMGHNWPTFNLLPFNLLSLFFNRIGLDIIDSQKIIIFFLFFCSMLSMWILTRKIFREKNLVDGLSRLSSAILYVVNPFTMSFIWWHQMLIEFFWVILPILFFIFWEYIERKEVSFNLILIFIVFINIFSPGINFVTIFLMILLFSSLFFYLIITKKEKLIDLSKKVIILLIITLFSMSWFLFPFFMNIRSFYQDSLLRSDGDKSSILQFSSKYSSILNTMKLVGLHTLYIKWRNDSYYSWTDYYLNNLFFKSITILIPILSLSSLLFFDKKDERYGYLIFFFILSLSSLFLMKGYSPPFKEINYNLLELPFGTFFRHPYDKFAIILVLSYCLMFSFFLNKLFKNFSKNLKIFGFFLGILITIFLIYGYPIWNGDVIFDGGEYIPSYRIKIPTYYYDLTVFSKEDEDFKVLQIPFSYLPTSHSSYMWENGIQSNSDPIIQYFLENKPVVRFLNSNNFSNNIIYNLYDLFENYKYDRSELFSLLRIIGVKYIVFHEDWNDFFNSPAIKKEDYELILNCDEKKYDSIKFDGTNKTIFFQNFTFSDDFTLTTWLKINSINKFAQIIGNENNWYLREGGSDDIYFEVPGGENYNFIGSINITKYLGERIHLTVLYSPEKNISQLYINGILKKDKAYLGNVSHIMNKNDNLCLGFCGYPSFFDGEIEEITIYDRILTYDEIISDCNGFIPDKPIFSLNNKNEGKNRNDIVQIRNYGKLKIIEVKDPYPLVYYITNLTYLDNNESNFSEIDYNELQYKFLNPTKIRIKMQNVKNQSIVVLNSAFDENWMTTINKNEIDNKNHIIFNGFANGWYIEDTGNLDIIIEYKPQRWFYYGTAVSLTTLISCIGYLIYDWKKQFFKRTYWKVRDFPKEKTKFKYEYKPKK